LLPARRSSGSPANGGRQRAGHEAQTEIPDTHTVFGRLIDGLELQTDLGVHGAGDIVGEVEEGRVEGSNVVVYEMATLCVDAASPFVVGVVEGGGIEAGWRDARPAAAALDTQPPELGGGRGATGKPAGHANDGYWLAGRGGLNIDTAVNTTTTTTPLQAAIAAGIIGAVPVAAHMVAAVHVRVSRHRLAWHILGG
jgi:hypothetical protein